MKIQEPKKKFTKKKKLPSFTRITLFSLLKFTKKKKKPRKKQNDGNRCRKFLDDLPEDILLRILSFLPTKEAVRTCLLSKSWESRWTSMPNFDFELSLDRNRSRKRTYMRKRRIFVNFVERAFCLRGSSDMNRFTLHFDVLRDASRVKTWISAALGHSVQQLDIELHYCNEGFSLPHCLFTCSTLRELILEMNCILRLPPTTICFSNLTTLVIHRVTFLDDPSTQQLFSSGLPVLQELSLSNCIWGSHRVMRFSSPSLRSLSIGDYVSPDNWVGGKITISAVSLVDFDYKGCLCNGYCLDESSSLEKAEIYAYLEDYTSDVAHRMYELLEGLSNLEFLGISWGVVEVFFVSEQEGLLDSLTFNNLTHLIVKEGLSRDADFAVLLWILHKCPCLNTLKFVEGIIFSLQGLPNDPQPPSFLSNLEVIEVCDYGGFSEELLAVKFLLKHAAILDTISIIGSDFFASRDLGDREHHYKELVEFPRSSQNCNIVFHY